MKFSSFISIGFLLAVSAISSAASLVSDFTNTVNPNGDWSYGYKVAGVTDTLVLFDNYFTVTETGYTADVRTSGTPADLTPSIYKLTSGSTAGVNGGNGVSLGDVSLHPGSSNQIATARWTAPATGLYDLSGFFKAGDGLGTSYGRVDTYVYQNSTQLFSVLDTPNTENFSLSSVSITAGDVIDVMVGYGSDQYYYDSTPVELNIQAVPEPASIAGLALGLAALLKRKRK